MASTLASKGGVNHIFRLPCQPTPWKSSNHWPGHKNYILLGCFEGPLQYVVGYNLIMLMAWSSGTWVHAGLTNVNIVYLPTPTPTLTPTPIPCVHCSSYKEAAAFVCIWCCLWASLLHEKLTKTNPLLGRHHVLCTLYDVRNVFDNVVSMLVLPYVLRTKYRLNPF